MTPFIQGVDEWEGDASGDDEEEIGGVGGAAVSAAYARRLLLLMKTLHDDVPGGNCQTSALSSEILNFQLCIQLSI